MDAFNTNQLSNLQTQLQQLQSLMNQPRQAPAQIQQPQKMICTVPMVDGLNGARQYLMIHEWQMDHADEAMALIRRAKE